jgi:hypothetical protein
MQLSIKIPPELALPLLERCAVFGEKIPSRLVTDLTWQCLKWMDMPFTPFYPLDLVQRYYRGCGREHELLIHTKEKDEVIERLMEKDRSKRLAAAGESLKQFWTSLNKQLPKQLHLKISQGMNNLPQRIKAKAEWLRVTPNALVVACLRDGLDAMDDPMKAMSPPSIVTQFWSVSHAKSRRKASNASEAMVSETIENILRSRSGPIVDTIVRCALFEEWDVTLREILREADALSDDWMPKD